MPATPARIEFVTQEYRSALDVDVAVVTRYGGIARDTLLSPVVTYFDSMADVQAMLDERFTLLKADRRKFTIAAAGVLGFTGALDFSQVVPSAQVIDDEKVANFIGSIVAISAVDYDATKTTLVIWG